MQMKFLTSSNLSNKLERYINPSRTQSRKEVNNDHGISLLPMVYRIVAKWFLKNIELTIEKEVGEYKGKHKVEK